MNRFGVKVVGKSRPDRAVRPSFATWRGWLNAWLVTLTLAHAGCSCVPEPPVSEPPPPPAAEAEPPPAPPAETAPETAPAPPPAPAAELPRRPVPGGKPAPEAECGHAVAFAGWRPDGAGVRDVLLVCDPGDNVIEEVGHLWAAKPRELPVHFGRQRPTIVLQPAGAFTVTGAIVVAPRSAAEPAARMEETLAAAMPDLSQDFSPRWPGLCGPTSGADVLFSLRGGDDGLPAGLIRGPGEEADRAVARLIAGGVERIAGDSLAGRMGVGPGGDGATNEGIRLGLQDWLDEADAAAWDVRLEWFDDAVGERPRRDQRDFFGRLAAAVDAGGGAVLCLWPGTDFANDPVDPPPPAATAQAAAESSAADSTAANAAERPSPAQDAGGPPPAGDMPLPEAAFPALPPAEGRPDGLPGRRERVDPRKAAADAARRMESATRLLERGAADRAYEQATEAVSLLHEAALRDPGLRPQLAEAVDLCRRCEAGLRRPPVDRTKPNSFQ